MMDRRTFLAGTGALLAAPLAAEAQPKVPRIGVLEANPLGGAEDAFRDGLRQFGYVEGKNIAIDWRWVHAGSERFLAQAAELVGRKVEVIVATNNPAVAAAQKATATIPIVMVLATDPVHLGFVTSLARPGGNITGLLTANTARNPRSTSLRSGVPWIRRSPDSDRRPPTARRSEPSSLQVLRQLPPLLPRRDRRDHFVPFGPLGSTVSGRQT